MANLINDNHLNRMRMIIERERQLKSKVNSKMSNDEFDIYDDSHQQYKSSYTSKFPVITSYSIHYTKLYEVRVPSAPQNTLLSVYIMKI